jgi:hypothetical protein
MITWLSRKTRSILVVSLNEKPMASTDFSMATLSRITLLHFESQIFTAEQSAAISRILAQQGRFLRAIVQLQQRVQDQDLAAKLEEQKKTHPDAEHRMLVSSALSLSILDKIHAAAPVFDTNESALLWHDIIKDYAETAQTALLHGKSAGDTALALFMVALFAVLALVDIPSDWAKLCVKDNISFLAVLNCLWDEAAARQMQLPTSSGLRTILGGTQVLTSVVVKFGKISKRCSLFQLSCLTDLQREKVKQVVAKPVQKEQKSSSFAFAAMTTDPTDARPQYDTTNNFPQKTKEGDHNLNL